jgi:hypothetical protein
VPSGSFAGCPQMSVTASTKHFFLEMCDNPFQGDVKFLHVAS